MSTLATWPARKMAAGGMAEVFLAQQRGLAGFERLVVVKRIRRELNADPRFVDPRSLNFQLPEDSPAIQLGFEPFDPKLAGVYGEEEWIRKAKEMKYPELRLPPE